MDVSKQHREIISHFRDKEVTKEELTAFCKENGLEIVSLGKYSDILFQDTHDRFKTTVFPLLIGELSKWRPTPEYASDEEKENIAKTNNKIEYELAIAMMNNGIRYSEVDLVTNTFAGILYNLLKGAGKRMNDMMATVLVDVSKKEFGDDLVASKLLDYYQKVAKELGRKKFEDMNGDK